MSSVWIFRFGIDRKRLGQGVTVGQPSAAQTLAAELRRLYDAAGRPTYAELVRQARAQKPPVKLNDATLSGWLRISRPTVPRDARALQFLVEYLQARAPRHQLPSQVWWRQQRQQAWRESHSNRGGRPQASTAARSDVSTDAQYPTIWNVPQRNPNFVGRGELLDRLRAGLRTRGQPAVASLCGMGGVGKTQIAIEYAHRQRHEYEIVWWVAAESEIQCQSQLAILAERLGIETSASVTNAVSTLISYLRELTGWLIVFDGAEEYATIQSLLPAGRGDVLVTTRRAGFGTLGEVVNAEVLYRSEAVEMLRHRLPTLTVERADDLADLFGDLPLALEQAAAYLERTRIPVERYLTVAGRQIERMLQRGEVAGHEHTLASLWRMSIDRIKHDRLGAVQLLTLIAHMGSEPIPLDIFTEHAPLLPSPLRDDAADPIDLADTVASLSDYSLVRRVGDTLEIHMLVQAATRHHLAESHISETRLDERETLNIVVRLLESTAPSEIWNAPEHWSRWRQLLPHVLAAVDYCRPDTNDPDITTRLLERAGSYLHAAGYPPVAASELFERALTISVSSRERDYSGTLRVQAHLAMSLRDQGEYDRAEELCRLVLGKQEHNLGVDHEETMLTRTQLASVLLYRGQLQAAEELYHQVLAYRERALGIDHPDTVGTRNDLAIAQLLRGEFSMAEQLLRDVIAAWDFIHGGDHVRTLNARHNLAIVLQRRGELAEAEQLLRQVVAIREAKQGFHHPSTLATRGYLAGVLLNKGELAAAERLYRQLISDRERLLGSNHPDTISARNQLALVLRERGELVAAERLLNGVLADRQQVLGVDHPYTLETEFSLADVLVARGNLVTAERLYRKILSDRERLLGPTHPDTLAARQALADLPSGELPWS